MSNLTCLQVVRILGPFDFLEDDLVVLKERDVISAKSEEFYQEDGYDRAKEWWLKRLLRSSLRKIND